MLELNGEDQRDLALEELAPRRENRRAMRREPSCLIFGLQASPLAALPLVHPQSASASEARLRPLGPIWVGRAEAEKAQRIDGRTTQIPVRLEENESYENAKANWN